MTVGQTPISLVMIARDEERCIGRALASAAPHVDEMVVVDTGSTDSTPHIAAMAGAHVSAFKWIGDFAAAKNEALRLATMPWRLVLDADEWIESGGHLLRSLPLTAPAMGIVTIENALMTGGVRQQSVSRATRILPRGVEFTGRVHETPDGAGARIEMPVALGHDGYLPESSQRKMGRNEPLLRAALAESPQDGYLWFKLGNDLEIQRRYAEAVACYSRANEP